ncbi:MAG: M23 family metallopeptidase, partial [Cyclobacteriaceae bacterium]|nr:M23 family metallopeptidase [Cyclobacteriaceae bacterium]
MSKIKYTYNTETCKYEPVKVTPKKFTVNLLGFLIAALFMASVMIYTFHANFTPLKEIRLSESNEVLRTQWEILNEKLSVSDIQLRELQIKDDSIYRTILDISPLPPTTRNASIGGAERFNKLSNANLVAEDLIISTYKRLEKIKRKSYIQTLSYDDITKIESEKEQMWASRPAIQPISNKELTKLYTTYGERFHPILNKWRGHYGLDFRADRGTPIYATANGVVQRANYSDSYGNVVYLNHGYDYKTRYAHLSKFNVKYGQHVKRGDIIGYVGNTGLSGAPHLHYEILYKNSQINPIDFFHRDLSVDEYEKLINLTNDDAPALDA